MQGLLHYPVNRFRHIIDVLRCKRFNENAKDYTDGNLPDRSELLLKNVSVEKLYL